ncbi:MAG: NAD-glutamate dehydrogenase [Oceanicaulis sp.]|uniref:NAD-glutamate dehydrogenase n=1 Tax=Glycocaulis sp. TaxID=1969725 RepID=UPI0025C3B182|nr:NAD-glutamate dehydrogenase [Glycocaulis sp.]MCC5982529.1 NAD-glutamate dehydrogenase [Oceanicaulis sp.]MCH8520905.1 NAD-glutamate dehydrogenase [Glycocaulis sp.]
MTAIVSSAHAFDRQKFLKAASKQWRVRFGQTGADADSFAAQVYDDCLADDMQGISLEDALRVFADFWEFASERPGDRIKVRVREARGEKEKALGRDVVEVIAQDKPFLVDSVMGEIASQGLDVLAMVHPIVQVRRDEDGKRVPSGGRIISESMIQVHVDLLDDTVRKALEEEVRATLLDVRAAVEDWADMRARMDECVEHLSSANTLAPKEEVDEALAFLKWLRDDHFAFIGCRSLKFDVDEKGDLRTREPEIPVDSGRGILRDPERTVLRKSSEPLVIVPQIEHFLRAPAPVIVAKANIKSRVHRRVYMDYIGVKRYREDGAVVGETRFVGLFTAEAYDRMARDVPLIRRKVRRVLEKAGKAPGSHSAKKLQHIVENYPRDELFQTSEEDLLEISLGILHLYDRPRTRLFLRRDQFDRFVSALLYVPRDRYNSRVRIEAGELLRKAFDGRLSAFYPMFGDGSLARVHFIIGLNPFDHPEPDTAELERQIALLARTWEDSLEAEARRCGDAELLRASKAYLNGFTAGYRERYEPEDALADIQRMETLDADNVRGARVYRAEDDDDTHLRVKLYSHDQMLALSAVLPVLENLGLHVNAEAGYPVQRECEDGESRETIWVHEFEVRARTGAFGKLETIALLFEDAVLAVLDGRTEDDGFNTLVPAIGVSWREAAFLRACARYRQQSGLDPSQSIQEEALSGHPEIARCLLEYARTRFDPALDLDQKAREEEAAKLEKQLRTKLDAVSSLDHDKALRRLLKLMKYTLRTNFYQTGKDGAPKPWISLKIASRRLRDLPAPKPYREIFVWSPRVEGVHLRFGPVARGGLRWSDRREDFRTEVLGLVKAQQVKNAVIVPVGSKGGFYPKQLPKPSDRDAFMEEGRESYRTFLRGMLDITDNLDADGEVIRPENTVCWDGEDPYLVVAADKGTASFSDIANGVATDEYDFWLADAFASGGSAGYDHKKMGITARGGWESVKRHFREIGKDIQTEPFTVIGIGDMSGDVFGNGMLLSKQIRLIAAFDHRDIFIDPDPEDCEASWNERKRLFEMDRSSWQDYDTRLISKGGGVFSRSGKAITLTDQIREMTGLDGKTATPSELIHALLKARAELMWFGGIGTYVKASTEENYQVGDKTNDAVRVNGSELKAQVVGEGANLALTQAARIEFARHGGRINADFIDNSAGVDSSDHEVNIKILLNPMLRAGEMKLDARNKLLESMTDDVAAHVLRHNYDQSLTLTLARHRAAEDLDAHERLMERLEADGRLDRAVEGLPAGDAIRALKDQDEGLTRPEIAILISYAKIALFDALVACDVPDDPHFEDTLVTYFPKALAKFSKQMQGHRLKREIIATRLANDMINMGGPLFVHRAREASGADIAAIARAFAAGRAIFRFDELFSKVNALDNKIPAEAQLRLHEEVMTLLSRQTIWLARRARAEDAGKASPIADLIATYQDGADKLKNWGETIFSGHERAGVAGRLSALKDAGAPAKLALEAATLQPLTPATDIVDLAKGAGWPLEAAARLYHACGDRFSFDALRTAASSLSSTLHWDRLAARRLTEDLYASQLAMCEAIAGYAANAGGKLAAGAENPSADWAEELVSSWQVVNAHDVDRADKTVEELSVSGSWTLSKVAIASTELRELAQAARAAG